MSASALLKLLRPDSEPKSDPEISFRTTEPPNKANHTASGVNLVRIVTQHGQGELEALDAEIAKIQAKIENLQAERAVVQKLYDIAMTHRPNLSGL